MQKLANSELQRLTVDEFKNSVKLSVIVVLDNVRSALNVGSIFRTADAFRITAVHCCGITPVPPHRDVLKSALGATDAVSWEYFPDTLSCILKLKEAGYRIASVEQAVNAIPLQHAASTVALPLALVFGHEMDGVSQHIINESDCTLEIPQSGTKHSLNIAVCTGIVLWEFYRGKQQVDQ